MCIFGGSAPAPAPAPVQPTPYDPTTDPVVQQSRPVEKVPTRSSEPVRQATSAARQDAANRAKRNSTVLTDSGGLEDDPEKMVSKSLNSGETKKRKTVLGA